jgi:hypothetical protein
MSNYKNIKSILKKQIDAGLKTFWTFNEKDKNFTCIYKNYTDGLTIYTPQQLIDKLDNNERK